MKAFILILSLKESQTVRINWTELLMFFTDMSHIFSGLFGSEKTVATKIDT
jgi:hypothetical protein